jgi:carbon-monoxide dehydrogenase large subunit
MIVVDYDMLDAVTDPEAALDEGAPVLFEGLGTNLVNGERDPGDALQGAEIVVRGRFVNSRLAVVPMEGGVVAVIPGGEGDEHQLVVYAGVQMPHASWASAAAQAGLEPSKLRLIAPDMGGGFGGKGWTVEHQIAMRVAQQLGRPTRWVESRSENLLSMVHSRSQIQYAEMGFTREGRITGMRTRIVGDAGAYGGFGGLIPLVSSRNVGQGPYVIPRMMWDVAVAVTNTSPTGAYRGAGRPEGAAQLERLMDMAADELGIDPVEIRRRNYLPPEAYPMRSLTGAPYDSGNHLQPLEEAVRIAGYDALLEEQRARRERGDRVQLGIGLASYIEASAPAAGAMGSEFAGVTVDEDGTVTLRVGTSAHGQGHATTFAMIVADALGVSMESINFVQSDSAFVPRGGGTAGSRSAQMGGAAVHQASEKVMAIAREVTAQLLEAAPEDIVALGDGRLGVAGVPSSAVPLARVAAEAQSRGTPLAVEHMYEQNAPTFPFGTHLSVVEVDTDTGEVRVIRHIAVDDCGVMINPMLVAGQVHGGIAAGVAQALYEHVQYDDDGNPLTATLLDYKVPSAAELPSYELGQSETPSPNNPLGAKGIGESGTTGATPAVQNAVVDALSHLGVRHVDMPMSPERVWRAIEAARAGTPEDPWREPPAVFERLPKRDGPPREALNQ